MRELERAPDLRVSSAETLHMPHNGNTRGRVHESKQNIVGKG